MMISPEVYIDQYRDTPYAELLTVREKLLKDIRAFERKAHEPSEICVAPSPEVVYQCHLEYLAKLCELIAEKYREEQV